MARHVWIRITMAKTVNRTDTPIKPKPFTGKPAQAIKIAGQIGNAMIPRTPVDVALTVFPYGRAARAVGGITGKGARAVAKLYRSMGK
jgi:hypothetical protein